MDRVLVLKIGCEGGVAGVYGREEGGVWTFWQEGSSWGLWGPNDEEETRTWRSEPVPSLAQALPRDWFRLLPVEVNPHFRAALLLEYTIARGGPCFQPDVGEVYQHERWLAALAESGDSSPRPHRR